MPGCSPTVITPLLRNSIETTALLAKGLEAVGVGKADSVDPSGSLNSLSLCQGANKTSC
jgi:hypothetical protein